MSYKIKRFETGEVYIHYAGINLCKKDLRTMSVKVGKWFL